MKTRCLIVDDEPIAQQILCNYLKNLSSFEVIACCKNALEAFEKLQKQPIDLLFLDIHMPQMSGLDFLRTLQNPPQVILTTAYRDYAVEGFELEVLDYLLKPISLTRFIQAIDKYQRARDQASPSTFEVNLANTASESGAFLYVRADRKIRKIFLKDIFLIEGLKDYVKIHTIEEVILSKQVLAQIAEKLPSDQFLRCHRSFIVALDQIKAFSAEFVEIQDREIPIGRSYKQQVIQVLDYRGKV